MSRASDAGSERYARQLDAAAAAHAGVDAATIEKAARASVELRDTKPYPVIHEAVREMLTACGSHCADLSPMIVETQETLLAQVLFVHELDVLAAQRDDALTRSARVVPAR